MTRTGAAGPHAPTHDDERSAEAPLVVIGASWGGLHAVSTILAGLPRSFDTPVAIVKSAYRRRERMIMHVLRCRTAPWRY